MSAEGGLPAELCVTSDERRPSEPFHPTPLDSPTPPFFAGGTPLPAHMGFWLRIRKAKPPLDHLHP